MVKTSPQKVSSPMKRLSYSKRMEIRYAHGLAAVIESNGDLDMAIKLFKDISHRPYPRHPRRFLQGVWNRYEAGNLKITTRANPKRSKMLSDEDVKKASKLIMKELQRPPVRGPITSIKQVSNFFCFFCIPPWRILKNWYPTELFILYCRHAWKMKD